MTPRETRAAAKAELARLLTRLLAEHDVTQDDLARCCGVGPSLVQRWCDRDRLETPSVADLLAMPRPIALALLRWAADAHAHVVADAPETVTVEDRLEHLDALTDDFGATTSLLARALTNGVSADAAAELERRCDRILSNVGAVREVARAARPGRLVPRRRMEVVE
jgi:transcriptional regulator with XRE-family HTH domain